ncbi:hypothetical protein ACI3E1_04130 [Ligilactobacillus sp. LYQ139]|uniref:hypothetical protein n=1 Tax=Ligilactobacillus sp. LYQ139 TaxID=3378800 RepID=UPI0038537BC6
MDGFDKVANTPSKYYAFLSFVLGYIMNIIVLVLYLFLININKDLFLNSNIGFQFIGCLVLTAVAGYFMSDYPGACSIFRSFIAGAAYQLGIYWLYGFIIADLLIYNSGRTISLLIVVPLVYMTFGIVMITLFTLMLKRKTF